MASKITFYVSEFRNILDFCLLQGKVLTMKDAWKQKALLCNFQTFPPI
jgi:hypothetical protein